jgi:hypothetical protein
MTESSRFGMLSLAGIYTLSRRMTIGFTTLRSIKAELSYGALEGVMMARLRLGGYGPLLKPYLNTQGVVVRFGH